VAHSVGWPGPRRPTAYRVVSRSGSTCTLRLARVSVADVLFDYGDAPQHLPTVSGDFRGNCRTSGRVFRRSRFHQQTFQQAQLEIARARCVAAPQLLLHVGRVLSSGGVADPKDAVGALDRFRETPTIAAGGSGSALLPEPRRCHLLNLARLLVLVVLVLVDSCGLLFLGAVPWATRVRRWARCGVVVAGTTCGQVPGLTAARRAAVTRSRSGGGGASEPAPRPETNKSQGRTATRLRLALPGCPRCGHSRSPVPLQHAHAIVPVGMPPSV